MWGWLVGWLGGGVEKKFWVNLPMLCVVWTTVAWELKPRGYFGFYSNILKLFTVGLISLGRSLCVCTVLRRPVRTVMEYSLT